MNDFITGYPSSLRLAVRCLMMPRDLLSAPRTLNAPLCARELHGAHAVRFSCAKRGPSTLLIHRSSEDAENCIATEEEHTDSNFELKRFERNGA